MTSIILAAENNSVTLLVIGLASGSGVIALIVKYLLSTPEREASAYTRGITDERSHYSKELEELKVKCTQQEKEIIVLRNGMLRLAVETDLSLDQKKKIANILGFKSTAQLLNTEIIDPE